MKSKTISCGVAIAVVLQLGVLACSAQTTDYLYSGSEANVTLNPGTYIITAYGAAGGPAIKLDHFVFGGLGAEMSAEFNFSSPTDFTLLVGGPGSLGGANNAHTLINAGGGGGGSFVVEGGTPLVVAGGGGGGDANDHYGGTGGTGGYGGNGGGYLLYGGGVPLDASGAGGGGGFNTDGGYGNATYDGAYPIGGSSLEDGGAGGTGAGGDGLMVAEGGFGGGGGGGGYSDADHAYGGGGGGYSGGGGGGDDLPSDYFGGAGGGGGSFIDSSAIAILAEVSGVNSPDDGLKGEIIITAVPEPASMSLLAIAGLGLLRRRARQSDAGSAKW